MSEVTDGIWLSGFRQHTLSSSSSKMHMQATKLEQLLSDVAFKFLFVCNRDEILHTLPRQALIEEAMPIS